MVRRICPRTVSGNLAPRLNALLLPPGGPCAIRTSFYAHPPLAGIAVNPTGQERIDRTGNALRAFFRPLTREREFHVSVPPGAADGAVLSQGSGPRSGHLVSVAVQFH